MDYITTKKVAAKWGITDRMVLHYCTAGRIEGGRKDGKYMAYSERCYQARR